MPYSFMDWCDVLYKDTPHDHSHRQPAVDGVADDKVHVKRTGDIEEHDCRDVPEGQFIMQPEIPVDRDVADEVDDAGTVSAMSYDADSKVIGNIIQGGHNNPCRIDAQETTLEEVAQGRSSRP